MPPVSDLCLAVATLATIMYLLVLAAWWFYNRFLHRAANTFWMWAEAFAHKSVSSGAFFGRHVVLVVMSIGRILYYVGCILLAVGAICQQFVYLWWTLPTLPLSLAFACIYAGLTVFCSIPGLLYGLCWAARNGCDLVLLTPSHAHSRPRAVASAARVD